MRKNVLNPPNKPESEGNTSISELVEDRILATIMDPAFIAESRLPLDVPDMDVKQV